MKRLLALFLACAAPWAVADQVNLTCPIDGKSFAYETPPKEPLRGRDLDMRPVASYRTPWPLPQCPENGFVLYKNDDFSAEELAKLRPFVASEEYRALLRAHTRDYIAAR